MSFLRCQSFARVFLSLPPVETQNLASPSRYGIPSLSVSCMSIHQPPFSRDAKSCVSRLAWHSFYVSRLHVHSSASCLWDAQFCVSTFVRQRWLLMACVQALRHLWLDYAAEVYCNICCTIVLIWCGVVFFDVFYLCGYFYFVSLHKVGFGSAMPSPVKLCFPSLSLHSPCTTLLSVLIYMVFTNP